MKALKTKHEKIFNKLVQYVNVDGSGIATLNEVQLLIQYGVHAVSPQEELLEQDEELEHQLEEINVLKDI